MLSETQLQYRKEIQLMFGCSAVFVALFIINYLDYMDRHQLNSFVEWDVKTLTSGDYTVEIDIGPDFYPDYQLQEEKKWLQKSKNLCKCCDQCLLLHARNECEKGVVCQCEGLEFDTSVQGFQAWFRYTVETRLKRLPDLGYEDEPDKIKVAVMTLAFNNYDVIELLRKRGTAIIAEKWDKQREIEKQIEILKNENIERLTNPCHIFLTFQNEEGAERIK